MLVRLLSRRYAEAVHSRIRCKQRQEITEKRWRCILPHLEGFTDCVATAGISLVFTSQECMTCWAIKSEELLSPNHWHWLNAIVLDAAYEPHTHQTTVWNEQRTSSDTDTEQNLCIFLSGNCTDQRFRLLNNFNAKFNPTTYNNNVFYVKTNSGKCPQADTNGENRHKELPDASRDITRCKQTPAILQREMCPLFESGCLTPAHWSESIIWYLCPAAHFLIICPWQGESVAYTDRQVTLKMNFSLS